jgi:hypothetical protein
MMSGILYAVSMFISAFAASRSIRWKNRLGLKLYLLLMLLFMISIIGMMAFVLHAFLMIVILFRSFAWAAVRPPVNEAITPRINSGERATFHSMMSLVSRLAFFALLFGLSSVLPPEQVTDWPSLSFILKICLGLGLLAAVPILISYARMRME